MVGNLEVAGDGGCWRWRLLEMEADLYTSFPAAGTISYIRCLQ